MAMMALYSENDEQREFKTEDLVDPWRSAFSRDFGRVVHCASFRRLQGKTQVFPGHESDFFRNRLTHSLEVAQIAEGIADRLNHEHEYFRKNNISRKLCATAALIHDIGHPPFGHNGERALDDAMRQHGGFEGNAQTIRIVSRLEKKVQDEAGSKCYGLNLCYRTLAAALKYDKKIPRSRRQQSKLVKGYYFTEEELVSKIKHNVAGMHGASGDFKTIECSIMDLADDIAYSTFDLEDCLKAGFLTPAEILSSTDGLLAQVAGKVSSELKRQFTKEDVLGVFTRLFTIADSTNDPDEAPLISLIEGYRALRELSTSGYLRTKLCSQLVREAICSIEVEFNEKFPMLSRVKLTPEIHAQVETLKQYTFAATIYSSRVALPEFRGYEVVKRIFDALSGDRGFLLMPEDVRQQHEAADGDRDVQMRVISDFVAGMTDRYAMEFYGRLHSDSAQSMFKPI